MNVNLMIEHRLFGECLYIPSSKVNLLSLSKAKNNFDVMYDSKNDEFVLNHKVKKRIKIMF